MTKSENQNNVKIKLQYIAITILLVGCISVITAYVTVKIIVQASSPVMPIPVHVMATATPIPLLTQIQSATTLPVGPSVTPTPKLQSSIPEIENNLLQYSGFEDGLTDWIYLENQPGFFVYEINGVNGKGYCSREYDLGTGRLNDHVKTEWEGISQDVLIDPTQTYYFSGWVKLNKAFSIYALAEFYDGERYIGFALLASATQPRAVFPDGETTSGWFLVQGEIPIIPPGTNHARIGLRHGIINNPPKDVDSTFCIDDLVFGRIIK